MILTVDRDEELRAHEVVHELELFAARMARDVDALVASVDDVGAEFHEVVDRLRDELLIARDRRCEMMTVSPGTMPTLRWSLIDMRVSADIGSPWLPS